MCSFRKIAVATVLGTIFTFNLTGSAFAQPRSQHTVASRNVGFERARRQKPVSRELAQKLQAALDQVVQDNQLPGAIVGIVTPQGMWFGASGVSNLETKEPMRVNDIFGTGSVTKIFTAVTVLKLVEEGILSLDDTLEKWLPEIAVKIPDGKTITIRQLLNGTAGVYNYPDDEKFLADYIAETQKQFATGEVKRWRPEEFLKGDVETFNNSGYAVVLADTRGMGASFGNYTPYSATKNDIQDYNAVVDWIIAQPWSNGKVGAYGTSADGNTAELLAATNNPAVKAVVPRSVDFDIYHQFIFPGGIFRDRYVKGIAPTLESFATNDVCFGETGEACEQIQQELPFTGVKPVDEDKDRSQLQAAVQQRDNIDIYEAGQQVTYCDDPFELSGGTLDDYSPFNFKNDIERSGVAIFSRTGWLDSATADGVLSHFMTFRNPQQAVIGPWNHGPYKQANPYQSPDTPLTPSQQEQLAEIISFFDAYLKDRDGKSPLKREIRYYTMGEEKWKTTKVWPPRGVTNQRWFFAENNTLSEKPSNSESGEDRYTVDFEATTGEDNRWPADLSKSITFNDRTEEDKKLLTYTSEPLPKDVEITGHPIVNLDITSTADDGAFFVYLEDVDENDNVTYITEGQLRVIHRKVSNETPPYVVFGPYHSFKQKDGQPLEPGKVTQLSFNLLPTSVLIKQGHRIRVAIAGHDKDTFARYPAEGTPEITVQRNTVNASYIDLPIMRHKQK